MLDFFISRITCTPGHDSLFRENLTIIFHRWDNCAISIHKTIFEFFIKLYWPSTCVVPFDCHVACTFFKTYNFWKKNCNEYNALCTYQPAEPLVINFAQCRMIFSNPLPPKQRTISLQKDTISPPVGRQKGLSKGNKFFFLLY